MAGRSRVAPRGRPPQQATEDNYYCNACDDCIKLWEEASREYLRPLTASDVEDLTRVAHQYDTGMEGGSRAIHADSAPPRPYHDLWEEEEFLQVCVPHQPVSLSRLAAGPDSAAADRTSDANFLRPQDASEIWEQVWYLAPARPSDPADAIQDTEQGPSPSHSFSSSSYSCGKPCSGTRESCEVGVVPGLALFPASSARPRVT